MLISITDLDNNYLGQFYPDTMKILINKNIKTDHPYFWRRLTIGVIIHELVHMFEFIFLCRVDLNKFINMSDSECRAEKVERFVLRLMGVVWESD